MASRSSLWIAAMLSREPPFRARAAFVVGASEDAVLMPVHTVAHDESVDKFGSDPVVRSALSRMAE
jgi:hypothetical protein